MHAAYFFVGSQLTAVGRNVLQTIKTSASSAITIENNYDAG